MKEAVVLEAAPTEEGVKGVHGLFLWYTLCVRTIDVGGTLRWQCSRISQLNVPNTDKHSTYHTALYTCLAQGDPFLVSLHTL